MTRYNRHFTKIDNIALSYVDIRPNTEKVIFFVHGNGNSADLWYPQLSCPLFDDYRLIAIDLPSHAQSEDAPKHSISFLGDVVAKFITTVTDSASLILVGLSLGGNIVSEMLRSIASPKGIVIVSSALVGDEIAVSDIPINELVGKVLFSDSATDKEIRDYFDGVLKHGSVTERAMLLEDYQCVSSVFRREYPLSIQRGEYSNEIALVRNAGAPMLFMVGENDEVIPPYLLKKVSLLLWKDKFHTFKDAGHFVNLDKPQAFNHLLSDYCNTIHTRL